MIGIIIVLGVLGIILGVHTAIGRLATPREERTPWRRLGVAGWLATLRRSVRVLEENSPPGGFRPL
ncbi:hypothetical protein [Nesterenkonia sp. F]|uniref:hypothetical protein n=1 Tax=Nesterenkonia sp. F TaxID=795955 RepID=UPI000255D010|nr:hypothetical protein [Nesterenkonia sp. F]